MQDDLTEQMKEITEIKVDLGAIKQGLNTANITLDRLTSTLDGFRATLNATNNMVVENKINIGQVKEDIMELRTQQKVNRTDIVKLQNLVEQGKGAGKLWNILIPGGIGASIVAIWELIRSQA